MYIDLEKSAITYASRIALRRLPLSHFKTPPVVISPSTSFNQPILNTPQSEAARARVLLKENNRESDELYRKLNELHSLLTSKEKGTKRERAQLLKDGLDYEQAFLTWVLTVEINHLPRVPDGFWLSPDTAKNMIFVTLDTIEGFKEAREKNDIKTMADLYRSHVIGYEAKAKEKHFNGQTTFFYEVGGLRGLMVNKRDYLNKTGSPAALLRFAFPDLIDLKNPDALDPLELELNYWTDPENAKYHIYEALDTIEGFKEAREKNDIKTMAELYRKHVIKYETKDKEKYKRGGQQTFFQEVGGLNGLMNNKRDFLDKMDSPASILRFALSGLIDLKNPDALDPLEVEHNYWTDPENAKYHIYEALDTIEGFKEAREKNDIKTMAELYRKHVIKYEAKDKEKYNRNGQLTFFYEVGGLRGLIVTKRDFLSKVNSPVSVLRFALPGLINDENSDALKSSEVKHFN